MTVLKLVERPWPERFAWDGRGVEYHPRRPRRACKGLTCAMKPHHRQLLAYQRQLTEGKQITAKLDSRMSRLEQVQP